MIDNPYERDTFNRWLERNDGVMLISTVTRVWDVEANVARQKLYELFEFGSQCQTMKITQLQAEVLGLKSALASKQTVEVNFSLFKRK